LATDRRAEATSDERGWSETNDTWGDRPGIVASLSRYRLVVVAVTVVAAVVGYAASSRLPVRYQAQATLILRDPGMPGILSGGSSIPDVNLQAYVAKQADIMVSSAVLGRALRLLGSRRSPSDVKPDLDVRPSKDLASITIQAKAENANGAANLANAVGGAYEQVTAERASHDADNAIAGLEKVKAQLQARIDASPTDANGLALRKTLAGQIAALQQREQSIITQAALFPSGVELFERAEPPKSPAEPKPKLNALLGALLGLIGAGAWAWWAAARNQRAEGRDDPAAILGAPLLGEIPPSPVTSDRPVPEAFHFLVASIEHELSSIGGSSAVVTSTAPGDGKTSTTLNVALAAQRENRRVVLIDGDERTRRLSEVCGISEFHGTERGAIFTGDASANPEEDLQRLVRSIVVTRYAMLLPVPRDPLDPRYPSGFFHAPNFHKTLLSIGQLADLVLIDAPALLTVSDTISIAGQADSVVLVVKHGVSLSRLREARDRLAFVSTPLIGYVFVRGHGSGARASRLGRLSRRNMLQRMRRRSRKGSGA